MMVIENRSARKTVRVQPSLLKEVENKLNIQNSKKNARERKTTIADVFEEAMYSFLNNCKK